MVNEFFLKVDEILINQVLYEDSLKLYWFMLFHLQVFKNLIIQKIV